MTYPKIFIHLKKFNLHNILIRHSFYVNPSVQGIRYLYTPTSLGIGKFEYAKNSNSQHFSGTKSSFCERMREICEGGERKLSIFSVDLRNMMFMSENEDDLTLLLSMAKVYNSADKKNRLSEYSFGPQFMRLYYYLNNAEAAKQAFQSEELTDFFNQVSSYVVYMTLLYNNGFYKAVIDAMYRMIEFRISVMRIPRANLILTLAACYKMDSKESFETALDFIRRAEKAGSRLDAKEMSFVAALALKHRSPHVALELCAKSKFISFTIKNIKIEALLQMSKPEDALPILRIQLDSQKKKGEDSNHGFLATTIDDLESALKDDGKRESLEEFLRIKNSLKQRGLVVNKTLGDMLCEPIDLHSGPDPVSKLTERDKTRAMLASSFDRDKRTSNRDKKKYQRKSLSSF